MPMTTYCCWLVAATAAVNADKYFNQTTAAAWWVKSNLYARVHTFLNLLHRIENQQTDDDGSLYYVSFM